MFILIMQKYTAVYYIYGFCNKSSATALRRSNWRIPDRPVFQKVYNHLLQDWTFQSWTKRTIQQALDNEANLLQQSDSNCSTSVHKIFWMQDWRTLKSGDFHQFHIQFVQAVLATNFPEYMQFFRWIIESR